MHCAGHAYGSENQCDKCAQVEKAIQVAQGTTNLSLAIFYGVNVYIIAVLIKALAQRSFELFWVGLGCQLEKGCILDAAAALDQVRFVQIAHGQVDARLHVAAQRGFTGDLYQAPFDAEQRVAHFNGIAYLGIELQHDVIVYEGPSALAEAICGLWRIGLQLAVEGKGAFQCTNLCEPCMVSARQEYHRGKLHLIGALTA